jgi:hypothetical protein
MTQILGATLGCVALYACTGCNCAKGSGVAMASSPCGPSTAKAGPCDRPAGEMTAELPSNAKPGECYAKVWVPPEFKTTTERVLVREASERLEIVPAKYEWIEERVCVKDESRRLIEEPAEFETQQRTVQTASAHTDWEVNKDCVPPGGHTKDVFCLVTHEPEHRTLSVQKQVKPACVREEIIPAEYETVRRQKLVTPATTRKVCIPAEYETVTKTVKVCDGRMAWKKVDCERPNGDETFSLNKDGTTKVTVAQRN